MSYGPPTHLLWVLESESEDSEDQESEKDFRLRRGLENTRLILIYRVDVSCPTIYPGVVVGTGSESPEPLQSEKR